MFGGIGAAHNQTVRNEESVLNNLDDDVLDEESSRKVPLKPPVSMIEREPEREPNSYQDGNVSASKLENSGIGLKSIQGGSNLPAQKRQQEQDFPPDEEVEVEDEEHQLDLSNDDASLIISESNDSIMEMKKMSAIPLLKNQDKFKSKLGKESQNFDTKFSSVNQRKNIIIPISQRIKTQDPYALSFQLVQDINLVSSQIFQLWHKLIEIITINPKFICEYLRILYEEKMREVQGEHIYRTIIETKDFAFPSEENVGEIHKQLALKKRNGATG